MKTIEELRKMDEKGLRAEKIELKKALFRVAFQVKSGQSKNIHQISPHKKQIAKVETVLSEIRIAAESNPITPDNEN